MEQLCSSFVAACIRQMARVEDLSASHCEPVPARREGEQFFWSGNVCEFHPTWHAVRLYKTERTLTPPNFSLFINIPATLTRLRFFLP
jgi:hypothetical protein